MSASTTSFRRARTTATAALAIGLMVPAVGVVVASPVAALPVGASAVADAPAVFTVSSTWNESPTATPGGVPTTVSTDSTGSLWYADYTHSQIVRVGFPGGETVFGLGSKPHVTSMAAGTDGGVWFNDQVHRMIGRLDPVSGRETKFSINDPRVNATSLVAGADRVWFAAGPAGLGYIYPSGEVDYARLGGTTPIESIDVAADGRVWFAVSGGRSIGVYDPATTTTRMIDVMTGGLSDIAAAPDGTIWVGAENTLIHVATDGSVAANSLSTRPFDHITPRSITFDALGQLYFSDLDRGIGVVDTHGLVSYHSAPSGGAPWDMVMVGDSLWFNDMGRSTLGWL